MTAFPFVMLGSLCQFVTGGTPSRKVARYFEGDMPWITGADINSDGTTTARHHITEEAIQSSATNVVPKGNILLVTRTGVGKAAIANVDICISQDFTGLLIDKTKVDERFLFHFLRARQRYFVVHQRGATIQGITREVVAHLKIPLPPLPEQCRIADILDKADAIRRKRQEVTKCLSDLIPAIFLDIFGDPTANPKGWSEVELTEVLAEGKDSIRRGPFGGTIKKEVFVEQGYKVYEQKNAIRDDFSIGRYYIDDSKFKELEGFAIKPNDLIISCSGTIGRIAIVPPSAQPGIINQALMKIRPDQDVIAPIYLKHLLETPHLQRRMFGSASGSAIKNVKPLTEIKRTKLPLPPLPAQKDFASLVVEVSNLHAKLLALVGQLNDLYNSLVQRAFRGAL